MRCPVCSHEMDKVHVGDIEIDFCRSGCKGVWFDNFELKKLDQQHEGDPEALKEILAAKRVDDSRSSKLSCPVCNNIKLKRREYRIGSGINVDQCYGCNGMWLDAGELAAIRENFDAIESQSNNAVIDQMTSVGLEPTEGYVTKDIRELSLFARFLKNIIG